MKKLSIIAIVIATLSLISVWLVNRNYTTSTNISSGDIVNHLAGQILQRGTVKIGYVVYPPVLIKDPNTGALSGIAYDLIEKMAANLGLKTEWTEEVGWGSMIEGLKTGRYDVIGTLIWPNSARAREATFSQPAMYSVVYPYVRANDNRFDANLTVANTNSITLATIDGEMTSFIAKSDFPLAQTVALSQASSVAEVLTNIITNKADLTFVEPAIAKEFLASHPNSIKQVGNKPVRIFENVLAVKRGENDLVAMLNVALKELLNDGMVKHTVKKYQVLDSFSPTAAPVGQTW